MRLNCAIIRTKSVHKQRLFLSLAFTTFTAGQKKEEERGEKRRSSVFDAAFTTVYPRLIFSPLQPALVRPNSHIRFLVCVL